MCENNYIWEDGDIKVLYIDENMNVTIDGKKQTSPWDITIKKATDEEVKNYIDELTKDLKFKVGDFVEVENDKHEKEKYEVLSLRITPD